MAEELTDNEENLSPEETEIQELEALLEEEEKAQQEEYERATFYKKLWLLIVYNKENVLKYGSITAGVVALVGVIYYFVVIPAQNEGVETQVASIQEEELLPYDKPNIFPLELFFLPVKTKDGSETGKFIHVKMSLLLSHSKLDQDLEKELQNLRRNIYSILSRKKLQDFENKKRPIEESLKREILTVSNSLLISGTGVITDVLFTEFMLTSA